MIRTIVAHDPKGETIAVTFSLTFDRPVSVVGDFNDWNPEVHPLTADDGVYSTTVALAPGRYAFRYLADGGEFFDDPEVPVESNGIGQSHGIIEITVPEAIVDISISEPVIELDSGSSGTAAGDELTRIAGLGPKAKAALYTAGITSFAGLADLSVEQIKTALAAANIKSVTGIANWTTQARALAETEKPTRKDRTKEPAGGRKRPRKG